MKIRNISKYGLLLVLLFCTTLSSFAQKDELLKTKITDFNSEALTIYLFQSYYTLDYIQRENYICNCLDSTYQKDALSFMKKSYKIMAATLVEIEKITPPTGELYKEVNSAIEIMNTLTIDIDLLEKYITSKREKDYNDFIENHKTYWNQLNNLKVNKKLKPVKAGE
jgi:hypothetical protein